MTGLVASGGRAVAGLGLVAVFSAMAAGCVSSGTHQQVVQERDRLAKERARLTDQLRRAQASNKSLSGERVELINQLEDLDRSVAKLRREREELEINLAAAEVERAKLSEVEGTYQSLVEDLESELAAGQIQIDQLREGLRLNLSEQILFPSGSAALSSSGAQVIARVAKQLRNRNQGYRVGVRGHTDNVPIRGELTRRYPTNWELAGARAASVVRVLEESGVEKERLAAISMGEYHPVASNDTAQGRAQNRRIEIRLVPLENNLPAAPSASAAPSR